MIDFRLRRRCGFGGIVEVLFEGQPEVIYQKSPGAASGFVC